MVQEIPFMLDHVYANIVSRKWRGALWAAKKRWRRNFLKTSTWPSEEEGNKEFIVWGPEFSRPLKTGGLNKIVLNNNGQDIKWSSIPSSMEDFFFTVVRIQGRAYFHKPEKHIFFSFFYIQPTIQNSKWGDRVKSVSSHPPF